MTLSLAVRLALFGISCLGATFILGCLRRFPLGFAGALSVGGYTAACLRVESSWPWIACLVAGSLSGGLFILLPALCDRALRGDEYVVLSWMLALACSEGIGLMEVTGGQHSLIGIPPLVAGESGFAVATWMLIFVFFSLGLLCWLFARSRSYQEARLIGVSPRALSAAGGSVQSVSLQVHWIAGLFGGLAGGLWGAMYQTLHPSLFGLPESVIILLVCLVGGPGGPAGVAVGLAVVFLVPEFLDLTDAVPVFAALTRLLGFSPPDPTAVVSALRQAMLGALLVVVIIWLQKGIVPVLHERLKDRGSQAA